MDHFPDVDAFLHAGPRWQDEISALREVLRDTGLEEAIKWGKPCYSRDGQNIAILQPMKGFLAVMFFKGALLDDPQGLLEEQGENTHAARRLCVTSVAQVEALRPAIEAFVADAVVAEASGRSLPERPELELVAELQARLDANPALHAAFHALTPGRQRAYNLHFAGAKRSETRARRVEQQVERILAGKGLADR